MDSVQNIYSTEVGDEVQLLRTYTHEHLSTFAPEIVSAATVKVLRAWVALEKQRCLTSVLGDIRRSPHTFRESLGGALHAAMLAPSLPWMNPLWSDLLIQGALLRDLARTASEKRSLKDPNHTIAGVDRLDALGFDNESVKQIVYQHHETMDGRGYPLQITGKWIYPLARIVAFCDALVEECLYGRAWNLEAYDKEVMQAWYRLKGKV